MDDILVYSKTFEAHNEHDVKLVLEKLKRVAFKLNKSKCEFKKKEIKILGHTYEKRN